MFEFMCVRDFIQSSLTVRSYFSYSAKYEGVGGDCVCICYSLATPHLSSPSHLLSCIIITPPPPLPPPPKSSVCAHVSMSMSCIYTHLYSTTIY
jgi:hypothetical protein